jgi:hypothetical protein
MLSPIPAGPPGLQGTEGLRGPAERAPRLTFEPGRVHEYEGTAVTLAPGEHKDEGIEAKCPEGSRPLGGGLHSERSDDQRVRLAPGR